MSFEKYTNLSVGDVVSRGWRFYRLNFKEIIPYVILPSILFTLAGILFNFPSSKLALSLDPSIQVVSVIFSLLIGFILWFGAFAVSIGLNLGLVRYLYKQIFNQRLSMKENLHYFFQKKVEMVSVTVFIFFESIFFYIADMILLVIAYIMILLPMILVASISTMNFDQFIKNILLITAIIFMIVLIVCTIVMMLAITAIQFTVLIFQMIAVSIEEKQQDKKTMSIKIKETLVLMFTSYELIVSALPKTALFGLLLWLTFYVISLIVTIPVSLYLFFEALTNAQQFEQGYSFVGLTLMQLISTLASTLLWPFIISASVLYYIDLKINREGFDILQQIKALSGETG